MSEFRLPPAPIITGSPQMQAPQKGTAAPQNGKQSFRDMLDQAVGQSGQKQLTLSKHAAHRAEQRSIALSESDMARMNQAVDKAGTKGVKDTLVLMNNTAFIVNVPNRVVVTIMDGAEAGENIFTNIDGAVIL